MEQERSTRQSLLSAQEGVLSGLALVLAIVMYIVPGGSTAERLVLALAVVSGFLLIWRGTVLAARKALDSAFVFLMVTTLLLGMTYVTLAGRTDGSPAEASVDGEESSYADSRSGTRDEDTDQPATVTPMDFDAPVDSTGLIVLTPEERPCARISIRTPGRRPPGLTCRQSGLPGRACPPDPSGICSVCWTPPPWWSSGRVTATRFGPAR